MRSFVGVANTMQRFGIVAKLQENQRSFTLTRRYDVVDEFLRTCRKHAPRWRKALESEPESLVVDVMSLLRAFACESRAMCNCHIDDRHVLKLTLACLIHGGNCVDWTLISLAVLRTMCPDQDRFLESFPVNWTAADVSNFIFHRPDWGVFVGMFGTLWKSVCDSFPHSAASLLATVASPNFAAAARDAKALTGLPLTPLEVLRKSGFDGVCASLRHKRSRVATGERNAKRPCRVAGRLKSV